ncbi:hypothetical protein [Aeromicrobium sp.]|uniref:hypothetical protein n=1 Tax=Aeromicrobium sp. TaxID=1871063 RepID=UPI002FCC8F62
MGRRRTPQEKKRLSLKKDRRNVFGENDKASRKSIPRAKSKVNRANRRAESVALHGAIGPPDDAVDEAVEQKVLGKKRKVWRKWPDQRLGNYLASRAGEDVPDDESNRHWH